MVGLEVGGSRDGEKLRNNSQGRNDEGTGNGKAKVVIDLQDLGGKIYKT